MRTSLSLRGQLFSHRHFLHSAGGLHLLGLAVVILRSGGCERMGSMGSMGCSGSK